MYTWCCYECPYFALPSLSAAFSFCCSCCSCFCCMTSSGLSLVRPLDALASVSGESGSRASGSTWAAMGCVDWVLHHTCMHLAWVHLAWVQCALLTQHSSTRVPSSILLFSGFHHALTMRSMLLETTIAPANVAATTPPTNRPAWPALIQKGSDASIGMLFRNKGRKRQTGEVLLPGLPHTGGCPPEVWVRTNPDANAEPRS